VDHTREFPLLPEGGIVQILHPFAGSIQQYAEELADPDHHESGRFRGEDAQVTDSKNDVPPDPSFSSPNIGDFSRCGVVPSRSGGLF
jgi:hypothetical protein